MGLDLTVKDRGGSIEIIQLKLEVQNFVIRNLTGRGESGGGMSRLFNGVSQFAPLSAPGLLPGPNAKTRFQPHHSANRIFSELAPMGYCMLVSLEERAFCSGLRMVESLHSLGCGTQRERVQLNNHAILFSVYTYRTLELMILLSSGTVG